MWHLEKIIAMNSDTSAKAVSLEDTDFGELVSELKQLKNPELSLLGYRRDATECANPVLPANVARDHGRGNKQTYAALPEGL